MCYNTLARTARWGFAWLGLAAPLAGVAAPALAAAPGRVELRAQRGPDGRTVELKAPEGGATALIFYSPECPISNAYSPTLNRLVDELPADRVRFVGVCVDPDLSDDDVRTHLKDFGLKFPVVRDRHGTLAAKVGASVTPEAIVIDDQGRVRYTGRIDDQFAARGKANANPATHELSDALAAVLAGREVPVARVVAVGCPLPEPAKPDSPPTYAKDVARILQKNCQECHRKGQVGPFSLETYEQARKRADDIATVTEDRTMPPWKPTPGVGPKFKHDRSLSAADVATLAAWAAGGTPLGDPADLPPAPQFSDDWALGTPDLVIEPPADFAIPAEGGDVYRCFVVPTSLPKDMYISAIEYRPGNRRVVHHMLAYVDTSGQGRKRDEADPGLGYECFSGPGVEIHGDLGGWAPGNEPSRLPDGVGRSLPKGADVIVQVHYHPNGKPETDRSRIGLHFARKPIKQVLHWGFAIPPFDAEKDRPKLNLPAGNSNIEVKGGWRVPVDLQAFAVTPHMHLLGRDIALSVTYPDKRTEELIKIDDWDFAWQNTYYFEKPVDLPKGSVVKLIAHFDNSSSNPRNPNKPPKAVSWGEATTDEMCIGFIAVTKKGQDLTQPGQKDDLLQIFRKQEEEGLKRLQEEAKKSAAAKSKAGKGN